MNTDRNTEKRGMAEPKMHVGDLQISPVLNEDGTGSLAVEMKLIMPEGALGRAAITVQNRAGKELLFHNMLLPGNMRAPMRENTDKYHEVQAVMSPRDLGKITPNEGEVSEEYYIYVRLYDAEDLLVEEVGCPVRFLEKK